MSEIDGNTVAYHFKEPLGVVGQIIPWNFPILMAAWKIAPALAAGNCIVLTDDAAGRNTAALLAVDQDDLVVGATRAARLALAITDDRIANQLAASEVLGVGAVKADLLNAERGAVRRALALSGGNVSAAARALGVSRATLHRKLHRLGLSNAP